MNRGNSEASDGLIFNSVFNDRSVTNITIKTVTVQLLLQYTNHTTAQGCKTAILLCSWILWVNNSDRPLERFLVSTSQCVDTQLERHKGQG